MATPRWWIPSRLYGVLRIGTPLPHAPLFLYNKDWHLILFVPFSYTCVLVGVVFPCVYAWVLWLIVLTY